MIQIKSGTEFKPLLYVTAPEPIYGFSLYMEYDPSVFNVVTIPNTAGDVFALPGDFFPNGSFLAKLKNNVQGTVLLGCSLQGNVPGVTGENKPLVMLKMNSFPGKEGIYPITFSSASKAVDYDEIDAEVQRLFTFEGLELDLTNPSVIGRLWIELVP